MPVHRLASGDAVALANGHVDPPVHLGRFAEVARPPDRPTPALVEHLRQHLDQRRQDRVAACGGDRLVKADVVAQEVLRVVEGREHARHLLGDRGDLFTRRSRRTQGRDADLDHPPRLEHLVAREAVQRREEAERLGFECWRTIGDERPGAVTGLDDAHRRQRAQADAHGRAADAGLQRRGRARVAGDRRGGVRRARGARARARRSSRRRWCGGGSTWRQPLAALADERARAEVSPASASWRTPVIPGPCCMPLLYHKCDARDTRRRIRPQACVSIARRTAS